MHDLVEKIKTLWREKVVTNYTITQLKIAIKLYEFGILTNK